MEIVVEGGRWVVTEPGGVEVSRGVIDESFAGLSFGEVMAEIANVVIGDCQRAGLPAHSRLGLELPCESCGRAVPVSPYGFIGSGPVWCLECYNEALGGVEF